MVGVTGQHLLQQTAILYTIPATGAGNRRSGRLVGTGLPRSPRLGHLSITHAAHERDTHASCASLPRFSG
eukprot:803108-Prorocentrum_lima.AAC.1